jgi:hypothetical protein
MNKASDRTVAAQSSASQEWQVQNQEGHERQARDWRKGMSDTVAYSLLAYTGLHIFATVKAIQDTGYQSLALFALVVLVFGIIPLWRRIEQRWASLNDEQAHDPAYSQAYRRDQIMVWLLAIGLPVGLTVLVRGLLAAS